MRSDHSKVSQNSYVSHATNATRRTRRDGGNYGDRAMEAFHKQAIDARSNRSRQPARIDPRKQHKLEQVREETKEDMDTRSNERDNGAGMQHNVFKDENVPMFGKK